MFTDAARLSFAFSLSGAVHVAALSIITPNVVDFSLKDLPPLQVQIVQAGVSQNDSSKLSIAPSNAAATQPKSAATKQTEFPRSHLAMTSAVNKGLVVTAPPDPQAQTGEQKPAGIEASATSTIEASAASTTRGETSESIGKIAGISKNEGSNKFPDEIIPGAPDKALTAPGLIFSTPPHYPEEARWEKRRGRTLLVFQLRPDGSVREIQLLNSSGHEDLDAAATQALRKWRFNVPASADGSAWYKYALRFDLL